MFKTDIDTIIVYFPNGGKLNPEYCELNKEFYQKLRNLVLKPYPGTDSIYFSYSEFSINEIKELKKNIVKDDECSDWKLVSAIILNSSIVDIILPFPAKNGTINNFLSDFGVDEYDDTIYGDFLAWVENPPKTCIKDMYQSNNLNLALDKFEADIQKYKNNK